MHRRSGIGPRSGAPRFLSECTPSFPSRPPLRPPRNVCGRLVYSTCSNSREISSEELTRCLYFVCVCLCVGGRGAFIYLFSFLFLLFFMSFQTRTRVQTITYTRDQWVDSDRKILSLQASGSQCYWWAEIIERFVQMLFERLRSFFLST